MGVLWTNGAIYTMQGENDRIEAVYTEGGLIIDIGREEDLRSKHLIDQVEDLNGRMMLPGLTDSHMHLVGFGELLQRIDLSGIHSREAVLDRIREACKAAPAGKWLMLEGWNENEWDDPRLILLDELDAAAPEHPVVLKRICRHALAANSRALNAAGLKESISVPSGGLIGRYEDGRLNGLFQEEPAMQLVTSAVPGIDQDYVEAALETAVKECWRLGLTGVHTEDLHYYNGFLPVYQAFVNVIENKQMPLRASLLVHHEALSEMEQCGMGYRDGTKFIELDAVKIFSDGSLGGRTALLSRPYKDRPDTYGKAVYSNEKLKELVQRARLLNMPVAVHAIGDQALENVLETIELNPPAAGLRDRLIHAQITRKDLIERARKLPVIFDIQPGFVLSDFPWVYDKIDPDQLECSYGWKTYLKAGIPCGGGSDAPIETADPLIGIYAAAARQKPAGTDHTVYSPEERLTPFEAVSLYTTGSAQAAGHEQERGKIAKGYTADFTILTKDLFTLELSEWLEVKAAQTVVGGITVYRLDQAEN